ncbi:MAG: TrmH family RNA methyltransferase [Candidatus Paceibacterota bacterium]
MPNKDISLILHDIRSAENVGSIFRTAEAAGVSKIYLTGYTPWPVDKFGRVSGKIKKAALGAEEYLEWKPAQITRLIKRLKQDGVTIVAIEQAKRSLDYRHFSLTGPTAFILGNEVVGLPEKLLTASDTIIEIPLVGRKESLNVAVAAGVVLFRLN